MGQFSIADGIALGVVPNAQQGKLYVHEYREAVKALEDKDYSPEADEEKLKKAVAKATAIFDKCQPFDEAENHPYFEKKLVQPCEDLRKLTLAAIAAYWGIDNPPERLVIAESAFKVGDIVMPVWRKVGDEWQITNLEFFNDTGGARKRFMAGGVVTGAFGNVAAKANNQETPLAICEGLADALTIAKCVDLGCMVALSKGNLTRAGQAARELWPGRKIIFCADNDAIAKNEEAAGAIGGFMATTGLDEKKGDFNDLYVEQGEESVRRGVLTAPV